MNEQQVLFTNDICQALTELTSQIQHDRLFILFDTETIRLCMPVMVPFMNAYEQAQPGRKIHLIIIGSTDAAKNATSLIEIWTALSDNGATRHSLLINVGGGMITDIGGFAAATFKRGIKFVNVATTLLGAVDAAVGGKTGMNLGNLKNEVGAFRSADAVLISTKMFETLDRDNLLSGYAEMLKHGLLSTESHLQELLDFDIQNLNNPDTADAHAKLLPLLEYSVNVKRQVVRKDPYEQGLRKALNLGHTFGHAFESWCLRKERPVLHGYAVAWGLVCELIMSQQQVGFPSRILYQISNYVRDNYGPLHFTCDDYPALCELMTHDKKNEGSNINFTLMNGIGDVSLNHTANVEQIGAVLDIFRDLMGI
ncbi:MAG: 3-dehydroquinate synthase [Bacteroidales bacterium]|nr:3-dehydroquinate synthase [Candidatus Liminaster caballi]